MSALIWCIKAVGCLLWLAILFPALSIPAVVSLGMTLCYGIVAGMLTQAVAIGLIAATTGFAAWALGAVLLGVGTAMVYPTLLAAIGDVAHPAWRARSIGVYRLWRDGGFAVGAILAGVTADTFGVTAAIWAVAALTAASGLFAAVRMYETHPREPRHAPGVEMSTRPV